MRYTYNLHFFFIYRHQADETWARRPALLLTQPDTQRNATAVPIRALDHIQSFDSYDDLFTWLRRTRLFNADELLEVASDLRKGVIPRKELYISREQAEKLDPPIDPGPGEVIPSEGYLAQLKQSENKSGK